MARRNVLITGATGKQGGALIQALLHPKVPDLHKDEHHVYALTRNASSSGALQFATRQNVTVVEGDLDHPDSMRKIFQDAVANGGIWGVFAVLAYPGLGVQADGEERQGKVSRSQVGSKQGDLIVADKIIDAGGLITGVWCRGLCVLVGGTRWPQI